MKAIYSSLWMQRSLNDDDYWTKLQNSVFSCTHTMISSDWLPFYTDHQFSRNCLIHSKRFCSFLSAICLFILFTLIQLFLYYLFFISNHISANNIHLKNVFIIGKKVCLQVGFTLQPNIYIAPNEWGKDVLKLFLSFIDTCSEYDERFFVFTFHIFAKD